MKRAERFGVPRLSAFRPSVFCLGAFCLSLLCCTASAGFGQGVPRGWQRVFPGFAAPIYDLHRDPNDPRIVYAVCGWQSTGGHGQIGGVLRSTDGGERWVEANRGIPPNAELLTLGHAPPGFLGDSPVLLLGTRGHGVLVSDDQGSSWRILGAESSAEAAVGEDAAGEGADEIAGSPDWSRLSIQAILGVPGTQDEPPAVLLGTKGHGVLVSTDGGVSWPMRNQGLLNLTIQSLARLPDGNVVAGTWYGGIYRTSDRGLAWESLNSQYERVAVSTIYLDPQGTLWVGMQNGGLAALAAGAESFEPQGGEILQGVGILAIATSGDYVFVGTGGRGAVIGRRDRELQVVQKGLESKTVSSILIDPEDPHQVLLGTWAGMYRAIPPPSKALPLAFSALAVVVLFGFVFAGYRRSVPAAARRIQRRLYELPADRVPGFLNGQFARLTSERGRAVLEHLVKLLRRSEASERDTRVKLAELIQATAVLLPWLDEDAPPDGERDRRVAEALEDRIRALIRISEDADIAPEVARIGWASARQDQLFAELLRAESPGQVAASRDRAFELAEALEEEEALKAFVSHELIQDLCAVLDALEQVGRLPNVEDRALFLGQALTQVLSTQERLTERRSHEMIFGLATGAAAVESVRRLLATSVQDLRQRAELAMELHSKEITARREAVLVLELRNVGQGHARNVVVELQPQKDFRALRARQDVKNLLRRQSARLEFLMEPRVSHRIRLRFRISFDDQVRRGHVVEFADIVELRPAEEPADFRPLHPNPYVIGRPLASGDVFIGRDELFRRIENNLRGANQDNVVVLIGQRRVGKTSILRQLPDQLEERYMPILVDLQGMFGTGEEAFFREVIATIYDELEERGIEVEEPSDELLRRDPASAFRRTFLRGVRRALGDRRLLLVFDEFEVLEERILAAELPKQILPFFRSLMQHEKNISFMFAGTHRLDELTGDYWGVLFNLAVYLEVGYLPRSEVARLFTEPTQEFFEIDPLALDKIFQTTGGHPHFSQLVARELVEHRNRLQLAYVTVQDVRQVAERVVDKGQLHISYLWDGATRSERLLMVAVKELLDCEGLAHVASAHRYLAEHRIEAEDLPAASQALIRREILIDNAGQLDFRIGLLRKWLDRRHDLESLLLSEPTTNEVAIEGESPEESEGDDAS